MSGRTDDAARRDDRGVTLVELLIVVLISGLLVGALGGTITLFLRTEKDAPARFERNKAPQGLAAFLQGDVNSTPPGGWDLNPAGPFCGRTLGGDNILRLRWDETIGGATTEYHVSYRSVQEGPQAWKLVRYTCTATGGVYTAPSVVEVSPELLKPPVAAALTGSGTPNPDSLLKQIAVELVGKDPGDPVNGRPYTVTATRLNTELGLCRVNTADPNGIVVQARRDDLTLLTPPVPEILADSTLREDVIITVNLYDRPATPFDDVERNCPDTFRLEFSTGAVNTPGEDPVRKVTGIRAAGSDSVTFTLPRGPSVTRPAAFKWAPGVWSLTVREFGSGVAGPVVGTGVVQTRGFAVCTLRSMETQRNDGSGFASGGLLVGNGGATAGQIVNPFRVRAVTGGPCVGPLKVGFTPTGVIEGTSTPWSATSPYRAAMADTGGGSGTDWTFDFQADDAAGSGRAALFTPDPTVAVTPSYCTATITSPDTVTLDPDNTMPPVATVAAQQVSPGCGTPQAYVYGSTGTVSGSMTLAGSTWTYTIPDTLVADSPTVVVEIRDAAGVAIAASSTIETVKTPAWFPAPCAAIVTASPATVRLQSGNTMPAGQTVTVAARNGCGTPRIRWQETGGGFTSLVNMAPAGVGLYRATLTPGAVFEPTSRLVEITSTSSTATVASAVVGVLPPLRAFRWDPSIGGNTFQFSQADGGAVDASLVSTGYVVLTPADRCRIDTVVLNNPELRLETLGAGYLQAPLSVSITTNRFCAGLTLDAPPGTNVGTVTRDPVDETKWSGSFSPGTVWSASASQRIRVYETGKVANASEITVVIKNPCAVSANPTVSTLNAVSLQKVGGSGGRLTTPVAVSLSIPAGSDCTTPILMKSSETPASPPSNTFTMTSTSGGANVQLGSEVWALGASGSQRTMTLTFVDSAGKPVVRDTTGSGVSAPLTLATPACLVSSVTTTTGLSVAGNNGRLSRDFTVTIDVGTSSDTACGTLRALFTPTPTTGDLLANAVPATLTKSGTTWVGTVRTRDARWRDIPATGSSGTILLNVRLADGTQLFRTVSIPVTIT